MLARLRVDFCNRFVLRLRIKLFIHITNIMLTGFKFPTNTVIRARNVGKHWVLFVAQMTRGMTPRNPNNIHL